MSKRRTMLILLIVALLTVIFAVYAVEAGAEPAGSNGGGTESGMPWWG